MTGLSEKSWLKINEFLLSLSAARVGDELSTKILNEISELIPFGNSANFIEMDNNFNATIENFIQSDKKWAELFNTHYSKIATPPALDENILWANSDYLKRYNKEEYVNDFLLPQHITFSAGFIVPNSENESVKIFVFNRSKSERMFNDEERAILKVIQPHICNYYKTLDLLEKLLRLPVTPLELERDTRLLSRRESEIVNLLFRRLRPAEIARELKISVLTVRKHIQNSYEKLHVTDRQQMLEKLKGKDF